MSTHKVPSYGTHSHAHKHTHSMRVEKRGEVQGDGRDANRLKEREEDVAASL